MFRRYKKILLPSIALLLLIFILWKKNNPFPNGKSDIIRTETTSPNLENEQTVIPKKALQVLQYIQKNGKAPNGYIGGKKFHNREKKLPQLNNINELATYTEWDVNPKVQNKNRGTQRIVISNDGTAWYTADHYNTFIKINAP